MQLIYMRALIEHTVSMMCVWNKVLVVVEAEQQYLQGEMKLVPMCTAHLVQQHHQHPVGEIITSSYILSAIQKTPSGAE